MQSPIFLPFDTETGGIGPDVSLLSVHLAACDAEWNIVSELELLTKPDNGIYNVTAEALSINKIDLIAHDKVALTYSQAGRELREFLLEHSGGGARKLIPMGKNIAFDVNAVCNNILSPKTFNQFVSYRQYDLTAIIVFLKRTGKLDKNAPESLEGLAKYYGFNAEWHTARGDNLAGIQVIRKLESL